MLGQVKRGSGKPDTVFISLLEEKGKRGQDGTALCGFSDVSTANMQCPENPVSEPFTNSLVQKRTHSSLLFVGSKV